MASQKVSTFTFQQLESAFEADRSPEELLAQALAEADGIREQARAEGHAEGIERARTEATPVLAALAEAIRGVDATRDGLAETLTRQAGEISLLIAQQVVAGVFAVEPERIVDVTRATLRRLADRHQVTVLVNPEDLELLAGAVQRLQAELGGIEHLDVQADRRIERGGAVAQTAHGEIDATVAAQIQAAREVVEAALAGDAAVTAADGAESAEVAPEHGV